MMGSVLNRTFCLQMNINTKLKVSASISETTPSAGTLPVRQIK